MRNSVAYRFIDSNENSQAIVHLVIDLITQMKRLQIYSQEACIWCIYTRRRNVAFVKIYTQTD